MDAHAAQTPAAPKRQRIGLLFVHGIGEQKRFEHVRDSVLQLSELMRQCESGAAVSVTDRTADWKLPPGQPDPAGTAPLTLTYRSPLRSISYDCYEAWWADLGARSGIVDQIQFWIWGLGQWCAPIYRELDAAQLPKDRQGFNKPVSILVKLPEPVAGKFWRECFARVKLLMSAIAALFVLVTWTLAKRVVSWLLGQAPGPTLIVQYVGDVRTYEERGSPGNTSLPDPGFPRRVGIRRRMITEMVGVATRPDLDAWYVIAHSLGSVIAYNALTEIGHALPNYLPADQWRRVPRQYKQDPGCDRRGDVSAMMPARPEWLADDDVINRLLLFERLKGFLTYGSPLDKFAAIWPRIVATADDRNDGARVLRNCRWVNLAAPQDPVADLLTHFRTGKGAALPAGSVPRVRNFATRWGIDYVLAHIRYFTGVERPDGAADGADQKRTVAEWLTGMRPAPDPNLFHRQKPFRHFVVVYGVYSALLVFLWLGTAWLVSAASKPFTGSWAFPRIAELTLGFAMAVIAGCGYWRWRRETGLNIRLVESDMEKHRQHAAYWETVLQMLVTQNLTSAYLGAIAAFAIAAGAIVDWFSSPPPGFAMALAALLFILAAIAAQSLINKLVPRLQVQAAAPAPVQPDFAAVQPAPA